MDSRQEQSEHRYVVVATYSDIGRLFDEEGSRSRPSTLEFGGRGY
jgi:hypothetical protein